MPEKQRVVMTISVPPATAQEYRQMAKTKGDTVSQLFRDMFSFYKREKLKEEFFELQRYGARQAKKIRISEKEIERLIFEDR